MIKLGIDGGTGCTGVELLRLVAQRLAGPAVHTAEMMFSGGKRAAPTQIPVLP